MNDTQVQDNEQTEHAETQSALSPGVLLAKRREELGLSLERVAEQLKMTPRKVAAIESDNYEAVHGKAIYKGFVRAYAKVLKMDPDALIALIAEDAPVIKPLTPVVRKATEPFTQTRMPVLGQRGNPKLILGAIVALVLLIGILLVQKMGWLPSIPTSISKRAESASASAPVVVPTTDASSSAATDGEGKVKQIELPAVDVSSQLASVPAAAPAPTSEGATVQAPAASGSNVLILKFREESWIELKRVSGSILASRKVSAGGSETFEITEPVQLTLGNGPGVEATLRGAPLEIPADPNSKVVRLNLK